MTNPFPAFWEPLASGGWAPDSPYSGTSLCVGAGGITERSECAARTYPGRCTDSRACTTYPQADRASQPAPGPEPDALPEA